MPISRLLTTLIILISCWSIDTNAQCRTAPPASPCTGSEPLVTADEIITTGTTKWYYGSVTSFNSLTMRGGTLIVCGDLTIDKFYMDSGQIIVNPGARFVIGSGLGSGLQLFGNSSMYNYGTLEVQRNLSLENGWATSAKPNLIINATTSAIFKMPNQYFVINNANSFFVNNGTAQFWGVISDAQSPPGSMCLGTNSSTRMAILINKVTNVYRAATTTGTSCIYVHQFSEFFGSLTTSPNIFACLSSGHTSNAACIPFGCTPNAWGAAQVFPNCSGCAAFITLPVEFSSFNIRQNNGANMLTWSMEASGQFYIERSSDGSSFYVLDSLMNKQEKDFSYMDATPSGMGYYRIRYVDGSSGRTVFSKIVSAVFHRSRNKIYPSPFMHSFFVQTSPGRSVEKISVYDMAGKNVRIQTRQQGDRWMITPMSFIPGQLIVRIVTDAGVQVEKVLMQ